MTLVALATQVGAFNDQSNQYAVPIIIAIIAICVLLSGGRKDE